LTKVIVVLGVPTLAVTGCVVPFMSVTAGALLLGELDNP
jgi:hypothetical protein